MPSEFSSLWQLLHVLPFVPRFLKNGLVLVLSIAPVVEWTCIVPKLSLNVAGDVSLSAASSVASFSKGAEHPIPPVIPTTPKMRP